MTATIDCFYSAHSGFAYIGAERLQAVAAAAGRRIRHRPYDIRRVLTGLGAAPSAQRSAAWRRHFFGREIERWSEYRQVPVVATGWPRHHHRDYSLANCLLIACQMRGGPVDALALRVLQAHWRDDCDLSDRATLLQLAAALDPAPESLLAAAEGAAARAEHEANTADALRLPVFGSPTYMVDGDMFFGQDRLELVERALQRPFARRFSDPGGLPRDTEKEGS